MRLGLNNGRYLGQRIDIETVLQNLKKSAANCGWRRSESPRPVSKDRLVEFLGYEKLCASPRLRIYLSAGIHGDEPAGPLAAARLFAEDRWPKGVSLWFCPCLNPTGFPESLRTNNQGIDLNRDYRGFRTEETLRHAAWLQARPHFDFTICLHEDWEAHGFYLYEFSRGSRPSLAAAILRAVGSTCPIDYSSQLDGWPASEGVVRPRIEPKSRPEWAEAAFLAVNKTSQTYTLESPSDFPMEVRVEALVTGVRAALDEACRLL